MVLLPRASCPSAPHGTSFLTLFVFDGALVIHRQVRPEDPFGACRFYFGAVDGNNQLGKEVDAENKKARRRAIKGTVPIAFSHFADIRAEFWGNRTSSLRR